MPQNTFRLGTRGSKLALAQAEMVRTALGGRGIGCEVVPIRTTGDRIQDRPLAAAGGKGLFIKELEEALLDGRIDLAVHSMKDVPVALAGGLSIAAMLPREDARDAFISSHADSLAALPAGARVGTSSVRRQAQVARARPDLEIVPLRGNVDTRLAKLGRGEVDAILLAMAGLKRLGLEGRVTAALPLQDWLPALSQGAIGIEMRKDDQQLADVAALNDEATAIALAAERGFQGALDGSCTTAIGGYAEWSGGTLRFHGEVLAPDGSGSEEIVFEQGLPDPQTNEAAKLGFATGLDLKPRVAKWLPA